MRILIILGHPDPESFNHAIASSVYDVLRNDGHHVTFHDLYLEAFDPLLLVQEIPERGAIPAVIQMHCEDLRSADGIVIVHPNWWGQPPAILKGWVDRVFRPGVAYRFEEGDGGEGIPIGLLKAKAAVVLNTSNTPDEREQRVFGDPLDALWRRCIFDLCGVRSFHRRMFNVIVMSTPQQRLAWLAESKELCRRVFQQGALNKPMDSDEEWPPLNALDTCTLIRNEEEKDRAAVHALNVVAFETPTEANLVDALRQKARPVVSLVAQVNQTVVGHIMFSPVKLSGHSELIIMGLAPMAVEPEHQRKGIGSALVRAGVEQCKKLGCGAVVVLGHPEYYPRFGFAPSASFGISCEYDVPEEVFMAIELQPGFLDGVPGKVKYHAAFGSMTNVL
jgi:NAD(P)H dehydrogenase (quinone)